LAALLSLSGGCRVLSRGQNKEGVRLFQQGYYEGAIQRFEQALNNDPNNADAYYNLAATYHRLGNLEDEQPYLDQAESYYDQALDRKSDHADAHRGLAVLLLERNRKGEAFDLMEDWVARYPTQAAARLELARLYHESGDRDAAKEHLVEVLALEPDNARALAALGRIREEMGEIDQALAYYERSLVSNRFQPDVTARVAALKQHASPRASAGPKLPAGPTRTATHSSPPLR
jgi:FimV-like protein